MSPTNRNPTPFVMPKAHLLSKKKEVAQNYVADKKNLTSKYLNKFFRKPGGVGEAGVVVWQLSTLGATNGYWQHNT